MSGTEKGGSGTTKTPADFLKSIRGRPVVVKLNSGVDYRVEIEEAEEDSEVESLESELKQMAQKVLDYRTTLPNQLHATLRSILDAQRPFFPPVASEQNVSTEESSSVPEDPETAKKIKLLNEKISSNCAAMPIVLKRMKDCIARIEKFDSYNDATIHPAFKRKKSG